MRLLTLKKNSANPALKMAAAIGLFLVTACDWGMPESDAELLVIGGPQNISMPVLVASNLGMFEAHGLNVEFRPLQNGKLVFDSVATEQIAFGVLVDANLAFLGFEGDHGVRVVATIMDKTDDAILARTDHGISTSSDLSGKLIGYLPATSSHVFLRTFMLSNNIEDVELTPMSPPAMQAAIVNGDVDAVSVWEPYRINAIDIAGDFLVEFDNGGLYNARILLTANERMLSDNEETVTAVLAAISDAEEFIKSDPEGAITILADAIGVDRAALESAWSNYSFTLRLDKDLPESLAEIGEMIISSEEDFEGKTIPNYSIFMAAPSSAEIIERSIDE